MTTPTKFPRSFNNTTRLFHDRSILKKTYQVDFTNEKFKAEELVNSFCCVAQDVSTPEQYYFVKAIIRPKRMKSDVFKSLVENEYNCLKKMEHSNRVVNVIDLTNAGPTQVLILEFLDHPWKNLREYLKKTEKAGETIGEHIKWKILRNCYDALMEMASVGLYHHDIKDSNIMVNTETFDIKLIDMGSCTACAEIKTTFEGSPYYASPEALKSDPLGYNLSKAESYAFGMLAFSIFYGGYLPFAPCEDRNIINSMIKFENTLNSKRPYFISDSSKDLILGLVATTESERPTLEEIGNLDCFKLNVSTATLIDDIDIIREEKLALPLDTESKDTHVQESATPESTGAESQLDSLGLPLTSFICRRFRAIRQIGWVRKYIITPIRQMVNRVRCSCMAPPRE
ncbi:hypothetical protein HDV02_002256 [Globomyces sp. JEL0801]|nr:hypothetical protein HDV02_002256 [Globomyces sp. JEL0801]